MYCCKHLHGSWRAISTFEPGIVWIVAIGEHDSARFYKRLADDLDISRVGRRREQKPACCGKDGWPAVGRTRASE